MEELQNTLKKYFEAWGAWCNDTSAFAFASLKPMQAGWKVPTEQSLGEKLTELLPYTEQAHIGTVDNRKIALLAIKKPVVNVPVVQVMQLRPHSTDPLGLDHVAFYCPAMKDLERALKKSSITWENQGNTGHSWISLWFGDSKREAKFFDHTALDLGAKELTERSSAIKNR